MRAVVLVFVARLVQAATCPPPPLPGVAAGDPSYDRDRSGEVLTTLANGELPELTNDPRLLSHDAAALWTRRWQLECAVSSGHVVFSPDAILGEIVRAAAELLHPGQPAPPWPSAKLEWHPAPPPPALPKPIPKPGPYYGFGGFALGGGALLLAGALALGIDAAHWTPPPPCRGWICFNDLDYSLHGMEIGFAVGFGILGAAATITGAVLIQRGAHHARERRVQPTASGLRITF